MEEHWSPVKKIWEGDERSTDQGESSGMVDAKGELLLLLLVKVTAMHMMQELYLCRGGAILRV